ncbi:hypothetical protein GC163_02380 [bacterium]|nr:hypothetical protein [bacterium]
MFGRSAPDDDEGNTSQKRHGNSHARHPNRDGDTAALSTGQVRDTEPHDGNIERLTVADTLTHRDYGGHHTKKIFLSV